MRITTKNYLSFIIWALLLTTKALGQQDPQFSQYLFNQNFLNPAVSGHDKAPTIQVLHRSQYLGYTGSFDASGTLNSQVINYQMPLSKGNSGIGLILVNDAAGAQSNQNVKLAYSHDVKVRTGRMSLGISAGVYNRRFNNDLRPREDGDINVPSNQSQLKPDIGLGFMYDATDYFIGLSVNHLNNPSFNYGTDNGKSVLNRTVSAIVGASLKAGDNVVLKPNIHIRSDIQTLTYETGFLGFLKNKYWLGGNYRNQDAVTLLAGLSLMKENALKLGFAYDLVTSNNSIKTPSSAEVLVSYAIGSKQSSTKVPAKKPVMRTPRYRH